MTVNTLNRASGQQTADLVVTVDGQPKSIDGDKSASDGGRQRRPTQPPTITDSPGAMSDDIYQRNYDAIIEKAARLPADVRRRLLVQFEKTFGRRRSTQQQQQQHRPSARPSSEDRPETRTDSVLSRLRQRYGDNIPQTVMDRIDRVRDRLVRNNTRTGNGTNTGSVTWNNKTTTTTLVHHRNQSITEIAIYRVNKRQPTY
ncbi:hypothetical protein LSH36_758g00055 [Paralvinella palmiformis]|uniref:Uncharacterized protein n=1 Tax=Paralvinella palmiformis TaxID=53620 RepID=A0AAD9J180_9ANNE|nr:hypothetical protein LSH36_758g00055 [Paralvinella palmiformis]